MTTTNNEIESIIAEVSSILRNRLNSLVNNVKNDENNEAVLNLPIVKKVLESVKSNNTNTTITTTYNDKNDEAIKQLQNDSQSCKEDIKTLTNMCLQISRAISDLQSSIANLSDKHNNLTKCVEETTKSENIQIKIVEKEKPNIIFIEEEEEEVDSSTSLELEEASEEEQEEESNEEEIEQEEVANEEEIEQEEVASEEEQEEVASEEEQEEQEEQEEVASEEEQEKQKEVASEEDEEVEEQEANKVEHVASEAEDEEGGLEVFEIEIDDVTYFATDEENGDLYEVAEDGDIGKKVGFIKDGEVEFI